MIIKISPPIGTVRIDNRTGLGLTTFKSLINYDYICMLGCTN
jgi:hypothetical protein